MGDKTDLNIKLDDMQKQIDESQVTNRNRLSDFIANNWKSIITLGTAFGILGPGQLAAFTLPSLEKAKISGAETEALQQTLRMTSMNWMQEIDDARAEVKADCNERVVLINEHWQARMDNHIHPDRP